MKKTLFQRTVAWMACISMCMTSAPVNILAENMQDDELLSSGNGTYEYEEGENNPDSTEILPSDTPVPSPAGEENLDEVSSDDILSSELTAADGHVEVYWSDYENLSDRRGEISGEELLIVYADGEEMVPQPEIILDSQVPF